MNDMPMEFQTETEENDVGVMIWDDPNAPDVPAVSDTAAANPPPVAVETAVPAAGAGAAALALTADADIVPTEPAPEENAVPEAEVSETETEVTDPAAPASEGADAEAPVNAEAKAEDPADPASEEAEPTPDLSPRHTDMTPGGDGTVEKVFRYADRPKAATVPTSDVPFAKRYSRTLRDVADLKKLRASKEKAADHANQADLGPALVGILNVDSEILGAVFTLLYAVPADPAFRKKKRGLEKLARAEVTHYNDVAARLNAIDTDYHPFLPENAVDSVLAGEEVTAPGYTAFGAQSRKTLAAPGETDEGGVDRISSVRSDSWNALMKKRRTAEAGLRVADVGERISALVAVLNVERSVVSLSFDLLHDAQDAPDERRSLEETARTEIRYYNDRISELNALTGELHRPITVSVAEAAARGSVALTVPAFVTESASEHSESADAPSVLTKRQFAAYVAAEEAKADQLLQERRALDKKYRKTSGDDRAILLIRIANLTGAAVTLLSPVLAYGASGEFAKSKPVRTLARTLSGEVTDYNDAVTALSRLDGKRHPTLPKNTVSRLMAGKRIPAVPTVAFMPYLPDVSLDPVSEPLTNGERYVSTPAPADDGSEALLRCMTESDLARFIKEKKRAIKEKSKSIDRGTDELGKKKRESRILALTEIIETERLIIEDYFEILRAASLVHSEKAKKKYVPEAVTEIRTYNRMLDELSRVGGEDFPHAEIETATLVAEGKPYLPITPIRYREPDSILHNYASASSEAALAKERSDTDEAAITARFDFLLTNAKCSYYGARASYRASTRKRDAKLIKQRRSELSDRYRDAIRAERADNDRYEAVLRARPLSDRLPRRGADRGKLVDLQKRLEALLVERDALNVRLITLYTGTAEKAGSRTDDEYNYRFASAKDRAYKKQLRLAAKINSLYIPQKKKEELFALLDRRSELMAIVDTTGDRIRLYKLTGKAKRQAKADCRRARRDISRLDAKIRAYYNKAKVRSDAVIPPARRIAILIGLIAFAIAVYVVWKFAGTQIVDALKARFGLS